MLKYTPMAPYTEPSPIRISTISALSHLNTQVNLENLFNLLPLVEGEPITKKKGKKVKDIKFLCLNGSQNREVGVYSMKHYIKSDGKVTMHHRHSVNAHDTAEVKCHFQNQLTLIWRFKSSLGEMRSANGFIFNNGKVKTVGLKCDEDIHLSYEALIQYFMENCIVPINKLGKNLPIIENSSNPYIFTLHEKPVDKLELFDTHPTMYNTDFSTHFKIMRDELFRIIIQEYNLNESEYEPDIYPAVKIKFSWNKMYLNDTDNDYQPGKCYCTLKCNGKGSGDGDGNCKIVTVCVFQSGKIIITGGNHSDQVYYMYQFMNDILKLYYEDIYYREPFIESVKKSSKKKIKKLMNDKTPLIKCCDLEKQIEFKDTKSICDEQVIDNDISSIINTQNVILIPKIQTITHTQVDSLFFGNYK
jgi:TATA-box binding protein (TBP) (component of TFIID and TFIIIB)